jgi:V8-like Glu-specific endopeptidase
MEDSKGNELNNSSSTRGVKEIRIFEETAPAVVFIATYTPPSHGTGVLISNDGLIFTNSHVVGNAKKVYIYFMPKNGGKYSREDYTTGMIVNNNKTVDLALIKLSKNPVGVKPLSLANASSIKVGQDVHAIGHPGNNAKWTYTRGYIGQILKNHEWGYDDGITRKAQMLIQSQTPIFGGNSGGPLLDDSGEIIGVNTFSDTEYQAGNYAVSVIDLKLFLNEKFTIPKAPPKTSETKQASYDWNANVIRVGKKDWDGDGVKDTFYFFDLDYTGIWELLYIEITNTDELVIIRDYDEDGKWNEKIINTNSNPEPDFHIFDYDGDGKADEYGYDDNDDGEIDRYEKV